MFNKIQNFFLELQQRDQETKKRWLMILSFVSMAAVVFVWLIYLGSTVKNLGEAPDRKSAEFSNTFKNGLAIILGKAGSELSQAFAVLQEFAKKTNSVTIQADPQKLP